VRPLLLVLTVIRSAETRSFVRMVLESAGHRVIESSGYPQAQSLLSNGLDPDLVFVEHTPASSSETMQIRQLLKIAPKHSMRLIIGAGEQALRNEAFELGIRHFFTKPVTRGDIETMIDEVNHPFGPVSCNDVPLTCAEAAAFKATAPAKMREVLHLEELGQDRFFLAASPKMLSIHRQVKLLADVDVNVLILGESGTGKEVIAHLLHKHSRRSQHKFVNVNCAALPADLLESELFGHQQGAFTGATKDRAGKFEQANHGTLLLDEIGEMSPQMQAKMLHVLQDGQFTRLGGQESSRADVRVLAATNIQMESALVDKTFREDLYYRLSAFIINVPPLRERREEIPYIVQETIRRTSPEMKTGRDFSFSSRLMDAALMYEWRGNIRELRNFVTRTIVMQDPDAALRELETKIEATRYATPEAIASSPQSHSSGMGMRSVVRDVKERTEAQMIKEALDASAWNRRKAAHSLNISYRALLYKIQQHRLVPNMSNGLSDGFRSAFSA